MDKSGRPAYFLTATCTTENPTICIIDDDGSVRDALRRLMDSAGMEAEAFASAEEFLASASLPRATCLILDVRMPGMDGLELQRRLSLRGSRTPIIFISAHADEEMRSRAMKAGAAAFFVKPFRNDALLDAVSAASGPA